MVLVPYFADCLRCSESLQKSEAKIEHLDKAEDGKTSEETHGASNQTDQLKEKNEELKL